MSRIAKSYRSPDSSISLMNSTACKWYWADVFGFRSLVLVGPVKFLAKGSMESVDDSRYRLTKSLIGGMLNVSPLGMAQTRENLHSTDVNTPSSPCAFSSWLLSHCDIQCTAIQP